MAVSCAKEKGRICKGLEVASGAKSNRTQLRKAIASLGAGDLLMVTRLDRLARSTRDLLNTLAVITDRKAGFRFLADAWADTTTSHGRLMLAVLGGLAEFERDLIRARTSEGRERAKARGVAARPSSPRTSGGRRSGGTTAATRRWPTSPAATTSVRRQFHASSHEKHPVLASSHRARRVVANAHGRVEERRGGAITKAPTPRGVTGQTRANCTGAWFYEFAGPGGEMRRCRAYELPVARQKERFP
jgi:hypothetical protein